MVDGILSGNRIYKEIQKGNISIEPFDIKLMNPNSYNVHLADELLMYGWDFKNAWDSSILFSDFPRLDMAADNPYVIRKIPEDGYLLKPGRIYLGRTVERCRTDGFVPMIEGRSSVGRLGLSIHSAAGFGDNGFEGYWTLELSCIQPTMIYPNVEIGQVYFHTIADIDEDELGEPGIPVKYTHGKYQNNHGIQPSMLWKEFKKNAETVESSQK